MGVKLFDRVEDIVETGENVGYCFNEPLPKGHVNMGLLVEGLFVCST